MAETSARTAKENGNARDEIVASIRRNLATSKPFDAVHNEHQADKKVVPVSSVAKKAVLSKEGLIENFRQNFELVGGNFTLAADEREATTLIETIIAKIDAKLIAVSDSELIRRLIPRAGREFVTNAPVEYLFSSDLGITTAQWAIAETGTLVLESEKESHRLTSLVPPVHLCVVRASSIRQTLGAILELAGGDLSRTVTFITGASRTSDIELTLAIGVHGPASLHVIVIADQ